MSAQLPSAFILTLLLLLEPGLLLPPLSLASALLAPPSGFYTASSLSLQDPRRPFQLPCLIVPWLFICSPSQVSRFDNSSAPLQTLISSLSELPLPHDWQLPFKEVINIGKAIEVFRTFSYPCTFNLFLLPWQ